MLQPFNVSANVTERGVRPLQPLGGLDSQGRVEACAGVLSVDDGGSRNLFQQRGAIRRKLRSDGVDDRTFQFGQGLHGRLGIASLSDAQSGLCAGPQGVACGHRRIHRKMTFAVTRWGLNALQPVAAKASPIASDDGAEGGTKSYKTFPIIIQSFNDP